ncbi:MULTISPECIES: AAA family ATPase [Enterococcus]|uniref:AAA family ATPase n=1 Tax=Enterococcus TaxID=1350 RepID=UPI002890924C|nr:AAA family ATPase [Enterococcus avium]MDT2386961.1 AAA family ATPase [Enterococcus avium]MDT2447006.1 AAA family ATPase [Enterococcus avium]
MSDIVIFYGSRSKFDELVPSEYSTLTELVYENDKESKNFIIQLQGQEQPKNEHEKVKVENIVVGSDEYAGVREHVIINFNNFLSKFEYEKVFLHNPPLQISNQIKRLFPQTKICIQGYTNLNLEKLKEIDLDYNQKIVGQNNAKQKLLQALYPSILPNRKKPIVILLYGRSGIGKTETAKFISEIIGESLFRKQFSMYQNNQFATYLFGGTHYEKSFAKDLLDRESNVLLLDEFDKAHPSFHSAFYQLFDEGIYEDQNYYLELKKSIIICTSNYSNLKEIEENLGSPIFYRFDNIIQFEDLTSEAKNVIGKKLLETCSKEYGMVLPLDIKERLLDNFIYCENVRQIRNVIQDTFAFTAIKDIT